MQGRATQGGTQEQNQLGLWAVAFVVTGWGTPWFLQEEVTGLSE